MSCIFLVSASTVLSTHFGVSLLSIQSPTWVPIPGEHHVMSHLHILECKYIHSTLTSRLNISVVPLPGISRAKIG